MLGVTFQAARCSRYASLAYWHPRSEWWSNPALGCRWRSAMLQRVHGQARVQAFAHGPAHEPAAAQVEHAGQIEPAFGGGHVGDVCCPHFVGSLHG